jgi:hypothetical protein
MKQSGPLNISLTSGRSWHGKAKKVRRQKEELRKEELGRQK